MTDLNAQLAQLQDEAEIRNHAPFSGWVELPARQVAALAEVAQAMWDVHEGECGCDEPGSWTKCIAGESFQALVRLDAAMGGENE